MTQADQFGGSNGVMDELIQLLVVQIDDFNGATPYGPALEVDWRLLWLEGLDRDMLMNIAVTPIGFD